MSVIPLKDAHFLDETLRLAAVLARDDGNYRGVTCDSREFGISKGLLQEEHGAFPRLVLQQPILACLRPNQSCKRRIGHQL
jgi:hypothetical protein